MRPATSSAISTTSATDSSHGSSLEWCSYGPTKITGRLSLGMCDESANSRSSGSEMRKPSRPTSLFTAAVAPEPTKSTTSSLLAFTERCTTRRASSRSSVMIRPVDEIEVWLFA